MGCAYRSTRSFVCVYVHVLRRKIVRHEWTQNARFENWSFWPISRLSVVAHSRSLHFRAVPPSRARWRGILFSGFEPLLSLLLHLITPIQSCADHNDIVPK